VGWGGEEGAAGRQRRARRAAGPADSARPNPPHPPFPTRHSQNFTIHGLWPNRLDGSWPQYCNDTARFAPKAVAGLKPRLAAAWPAFGDGGDVGFWRHEWLRHGTCAAGALAVNETAYFEAALDLNDRLPLLAPLEAAGIHPSNTVARPHSVVVAALKAGLGVTPAVHCGAGAGGSKVTEVWVCVDKDGATPIDCPPAIKGKKGPGGAKGGQGKCANVTLPTLAGAAGAGSKGGGGGNGKAAGGAPATPAPALVKAGGPQDGWGGLG